MTFLDLSQPSGASLADARRISAARELLRRRQARGSLIGFTEYTNDRYQTAVHHRIMAAALEDVTNGIEDRVMFFTPPRHGKSELVSRRFPAYYLAGRPHDEIISASYGSDLANDFGREVRNIIAGRPYQSLYPSVKLAQDSQAKDRWHTAQGGGYVAVGVGSALTGRGANILNIDDPHKDRQEADSESIRDRIWDWYTSTAYTRLMPGGAVILTMTRWHEDDLAGRLLEEAKRGGDQWKVINLPAFNTGEYEDLPEGEALWPARYPVAALERIRGAQGGPDSRDWASLYEQRPRPQAGSLFKIAMISTIEALPANCEWVRAWDLAGTKDSGGRDPDWTAGILIGKTDNGAFVIGDVVRLRGGPDEVEAAIVNTAARDGRGVRIGLPQDPGQAGKSQVLYLTKKLFGFNVESSPESGDKATRAGPVCSQVNVGNVAVVRGIWNKPYLDELAAFPAGAKDDQVDGTSRGFGMLIEDDGLSIWERIGRQQGVA